MKFGLLSYLTDNLGDEIQSIAAQRFLPRVDLLLPRDTLSQVASEEPIHAILNGWFVSNPALWPPSPAINCLLISMHLNNRQMRRTFWRGRISHQLTRGAGGEWFRRHGPVGARDRTTLRILQRAGVESWYSGCLTLTLPNQASQREDKIVLCDVPNTTAAIMRYRFRTPLIEVSHRHCATTGQAERILAAEKLLALYARAKVVVTSRLHCALPCLALGTPVLFVPIDPDLSRQEPALELCHNTSLTALTYGKSNFDCDAPPPNPSGWEAVAKELQARCVNFVRALPGERTI